MLAERIHLKAVEREVDPIAVEAKKLVSLCRKILRRRNPTEEDFKIAFTEVLHKSLRALEIEHEVRFEKNVVQSKRADALYPSLIIEYKKPGKLADSKTLERVALQLGQYLKGVMGKNLNRRMVGVAIDGRHMVIVRCPEYSLIGKRKKIVQLDLEGREIDVIVEWESSSRMDVSDASMERLLLLFRGLVKKTLSPKALVEDFGLDGAAATKMLRALANALVGSQSPRVDTLYKEWRRLFGIVYGEKTGKHHETITRIMTKIGVKAAFDIHQVLFLIHTYFALLMKMICIEVLSIQQSTLLSSYVKEWAIIDDDDKLLEELKDLESGGIFINFGITNFLEGDFFSWYTFVWDRDLAEGIRLMSKKLTNYEPATPSLEPEVVRDLLKKIYQYLVPKSIRHDLGEYYTPDWLAQLTLDEVGYNGDPDIRILDPACGSGTFLVEILQRITMHIRNFPERYPNKDAVLKKILTNVVGFDINPIAVLAARTNFIIALSFIRSRSRVRGIEIPIYLADSVLLPTKFMTPFDPNEESANYRLMTSIGTPFIIPPVLADRKTLSAIMGILEEIVLYKRSRKTFLDRAMKLLGQEVVNRVKNELTNLFDLLARLEAEGRNRIWTRIIKNSFAPVFVDPFDFVVGNPPWINWEYLSKEYREATRMLWQDYGLLPVKSNAKKQFELGKTKRDFSMLFTYAVIDLYLKEKGSLAFLITQTVFKTIGGDVFRKFRLPRRAYLGVKTVHDFVKVNPFEGASNRTALFVLEKGRKTVYPVEYHVWSRTGRTPPTDANLIDARKVLAIEKKVAVPVSRQLTDVWLTTGENSLSGIRKVLGESAYTSHAGVTTWLNGVYFLEVVEGLPDGKLHVKNMGDVGKKKMPIREARVEPDLIYVLIRGRDISRWGIETNQYAMIPHLPSTGWRAISEDAMMTDYPETYKFLHRFRNELENRSGKKQLRKNHPFYILGSTGKHTFEPHKVAWGSISKRVSAAVLEPKDDPYLGKKMPMLEHSAMYLETSSWDEAHFVCALLNSMPVQVTINCFVGMGAYGNVSRLVKIPRFDPNDSSHLRLSDLSKTAHEQIQLGKDMQTIEVEIDRLASEIWNLDEYELDALSEELSHH